MTVKILAVDPRWQDPIRLAFMRDYLTEGFELVIPESFDHATLLREAETASALLTGQAPITSEMMAVAPHLRLVGKIGTGVDSIDIAAATAAGIPVAHSPGWMRATPVAEHVFMLMLTLARRPWLWRSSGNSPLHLPLEGSTLGIVGLGAIGQRVARRAASFDMTILAYTRTPGKFHPDGFIVEEVDALADLLSRADFVVLTVPLTPATRGLIGAPELALMRSSAVLINVARGPHVVTEELVEALHARQIAGAGLDVTDPEPLPEGHVLRSFPNVVLSPHVAAQSESVQRQSVKLLCESIRLAVHGERVQALVNPEMYQGT
jgi:phosphoglycerate dehydrogenase-like enzyme